VGYLCAGIKTVEDARVRKGSERAREEGGARMRERAREREHREVEGGRGKGARDKGPNGLPQTSFRERVKEPDAEATSRICWGT
jgi:hypothetical protein